MATSTSTGSLTLADRVYATAFPETPVGHMSPIDALGQTVTRAIESAEGDEQKAADAREWGLALGVAIAIARCEDPFEPMHRVVKRALLAAADAWNAYAGPDVLPGDVIPFRRTEAVA